jgi:regulator of protease activity HflC (stomatin/prohibitin superfamily)
MKDLVERRLPKINGFIALVIELALFGEAIRLYGTLGPGFDRSNPGAAFWWATALIVVACIAIGGFFIVQPNEAKVATFFGSYAGSARASGFSWANPFVKRRAVSLRAKNFGSQILKVNDAHGNPIEIGAIVVWRVTDSAKALFNVEDYQSFVTVQSETALRVLAGRFPYDSGADGEAKISLRANQDEIAHELKSELHSRLEVAGVTIDDARLSHLAYAPEIAQAMLRRQQASAIIAARRLIVDGAVGMVKLALDDLEAQGVVKLDNERRAAMVNNLLVALVSETEAQPVINTGTLYT